MEIGQVVSEKKFKDFGGGGGVWGFIRVLGAKTSKLVIKRKSPIAENERNISSYL